MGWVVFGNVLYIINSKGLQLGLRGENGLLLFKWFTYKLSEKVSYGFIG